MKKRILSLFLVIVFLLPVFSFFTPLVSAGTEKSDIDEMPVRVGIHFKSGSTSYLRVFNSIYSGNGLSFYIGSESKTPLITTKKRAVLVTDTFVRRVEESGKKPYYIKCAVDNAEHKPFCYYTEEAYDSIETVNRKIEEIKAKTHWTSVYPMYIYGGLHIGIGRMSDYEELSQNEAYFTNVLETGLKLYSPASTVITVLDDETGDILMKVDTASAKLFADAVDGYIEKQNSANTQRYNYDGTFEYGMTEDGLSLVNIVPFDSYIKSVIPYEISSSWNYETMKAFAVTVRTYTLYKMKSVHNSLGFHVCDMTHCQAYLGVDRTTQNVRNAVDETKDMILTYDNKVVSAFYHAISGGATETCGNVWGGGDKPYLVAQSTPMENYSKYSYGVWSTTVSLSELSGELVNKYSLSGSVSDVSITAYTDMGYAYKMVITYDGGKTKTVTTSDAIRTALSKYCKSGRITITKNGDEYTFSGTGWGHGVGLSQYGAKDMGEQGKKWNEILHFYFPGTSIDRVVIDTSTLEIISSVKYDEQGPDPTTPPTPVVPTPTSLSSDRLAVNNSRRLISKISIGTTVAELISGINERDYVTIKSDGAIADSSAKATTGMEVVLSGVGSYYVVVTGDLNGDGAVTLTDFVKLKSVILGMTSVSGVYELAADISGDENVTLTDFVQMKAHILGKSSIVARAF